jgi:hypothetical protein
MEREKRRFEWEHLLEGLDVLDTSEGVLLVALAAATLYVIFLVLRRFLI